MTLPYFTFQPNVGRNSLFVGLTEEQREELGGVEYRAVKLLLKVLLSKLLNREIGEADGSVLLWTFGCWMGLSWTMDSERWDFWSCR